MGGWERRRKESEGVNLSVGEERDMRMMRMEVKERKRK